MPRGQTSDVDNGLMTDDAGQRALRDAVATLIARLRSAPSAVGPRGDTEHAQHRAFARRGRLLAMHLEQALRASDDLAYPQAFALLRTALDHRVFDRLLFLGTVYAREIERVSEETWATWQTGPRPPYLQSWERRPGNKVYTVWEVPVLDDAGNVVYTLSIYYKWWQEFDPLAVPPAQFDDIASGHPSRRAQMRGYHAAQKLTWGNWFAWLHLKENLQVNDLASAREILQLDVHHRFLSAFTHPFSEGVTDDVYHPIYHGDWPIPDHYAEELVLLYAATFAIDELHDLELMTRREPAAAFARWDEVLSDIDAAERQVAHFWAPGRPPFSFDRIHEANQRVFDAYDAQHAAGTPLTRPDIPDPLRMRVDEIRYYADPLRRLVRLHHSSREGMTGLTWQSPWPRDDRRF